MDVCEKILLVFLLIIADTATVEVRVKIPHSRITPFYNVVLECSYDFGNENPYMLSWYKDTKEFFRYKFKENFIQVFPVAGVNVNIQLSSSHQIVLENVSSATNGEYLCEVTGNPPKHIIAFDADHLKISDASPVQVKLSSNLVKTGKNVTLQCLYDEKKAYSIRWFRDNLEFFNYTFGDNRSQILPLNGIHINNEESSANKVVLVNVSQQTSGEYKCQVRTNYPNVSLIMTDSNYLNVSDYPIELKISKAEVKPGENVTLSCLYDFGEENMYSIKWYKDNEEFFRYVFRDNRTSFFTVDGVNVNRQLSSSNKVILENVRGKTEGLYMCEVSTDAPSFISISGYRQLKLSGMYSLQVKVPDRLVKPGEDVTLWCLYYFGDDELYSIKWYKENSEFFRYEPWRNGTYVFPIRGIQVNEKQSSADRVVLKNVSTEADGKYTCIVEAEAPTFSSSMNTSYLHIMRVPSEKPVITVKHHVIPEGEKFICKCMIPSSYPKSELTWSLNGKKVIGENEYRDNLTSNTFYLTLRDNSKAELTCTARIFENEIQDLYNEKTTIVLKRNQHSLTDSYESTRQPTNISFVSAVAQSTTIEAQTLKIIVVVMCLLWFC